MKMFAQKQESEGKTFRGYGWKKEAHAAGCSNCWGGTICCYLNIQGETPWSPSLSFYGKKKEKQKMKLGTFKEKAQWARKWCMQHSIYQDVPPRSWYHGGGAAKLAMRVPKEVGEWGGRCPLLLEAPLQKTETREVLPPSKFLYSQMTKSNRKQAGKGA